MTYKALVVEHDAEAIEAIGEILESLGHRFDVAHSQAEALQCVGDRKYSYIVSGIEIPARSRKGKPRIQNMENMLDRLGETVDGTCPPIIIMTDHKAPKTPLLVEMMRLAANLHDKGATDFIGKPFPASGRTLDRVIKKVLGLYVPVYSRPQARRTSKKGIRVSSPRKRPASDTKRSASKEGKGGRGAPDTSSPPALAKAEKDVLQAVAECPRETMLVIEISGAAGYSRNTSQKCLARLLKMGMVHRPCGPRKGYAVTERGLAFPGKPAPEKPARNSRA